MTLPRFSYTVLFTLLLPVILLRLWLRGRLLPAYRKRIKERFGSFTKPEYKYDKTIWIHTVSVGESIAATPLIKHFIAQNNCNIVITCTTPTGSKQIQNTFKDSVFHVYIPYDLPFFNNRFLHKIKPHIAIFMETELWPNTLECCTHKNIKTLLINGRLSKKSAKGYGRFSNLSKEVMANINYAAIQNQNDANRFYQLGLNQKNTQVTGNIKFDISLNSEIIEQAKKIKAQYSLNNTRPIIIAASTHAGEDDIILKAFKLLINTHANALLLLVPRHPDRFDQVFTLCKEKHFTTIRRSENTQPSEQTQIILGDTMGELSMLYGASDIAFVGGSLVDNGGHNYIEPAAWAVPIISGPSQFNFLDIARELEKIGALKTVENAQTLTQHIKMLLDNNEKRAQTGQQGLNYIDKNKGALERTIGFIERCI